MEPADIKSVRRGRKWRRNKLHNVSSAEQHAGPKAKKPAILTKSKVFVGQYVKKEFKGSGIFIGKIVYYDKGLYKVDYEDGDCEDLESDEVHQLLVRDDVFKGSLLTRKKLDELVLNKSYGSKTNAVVDKVVEVSSLTEMTCCDNDGSTIENHCGQVDGDADSSSDSCEHVWGRESGLEAEILLVPPLQLPPSSGL